MLSWVSCGFNKAYVLWKAILMLILLWYLTCYALWLIPILKLKLYIFYIWFVLTSYSLEYWFFNCYVMPKRLFKCLIEVMVKIIETFVDLLSTIDNLKAMPNFWRFEENNYSSLKMIFSLYRTVSAPQCL